MAKIGRPRAEVVLTDERADGVDALDEARARQSGGRLPCPGGAGGRGRRPDKAVARACARRRRRWPSGGAVSSRADWPGCTTSRGSARRGPVSDDAVEAVIVKTLETTPKGETHWSTRTMAKAAGMSHTMVGRIWRTFGLQPHRHRVLQAVARPATGRQSARRRRAVYGSAAQRRRVLVRREIPDPGAPTRAADPADGSRPTRAADPQLPAAWHARSLRRAERRHRRGAHAVHRRSIAPRISSRSSATSTRASRRA